MTVKGKILVSIAPLPEADPVEESAVYVQDEALVPRILIADAIVEALEGRKISVVDLHMILPADSAKALLRGMIDGETEIAITGMSQVSESSQK